MCRGQTLVLAPTEDARPAHRVYASSARDSPKSPGVSDNGGRFGDEAVAVFAPLASERRPGGAARLAPKTDRTYGLRPRPMSRVVRATSFDLTLSNQGCPHSITSPRTASATDFGCGANDAVHLGSTPRRAPGDRAEEGEQRTERVSGNNPNLTPRELEVLAYLSAGTTNGEIATALHISLSTVKGHLRSIYAKLHVSNRTEAALVGLDVFPMLKVYAS